MNTAEITHRARAVVADLHELLVHEFDAAKGRRLKQLDLGLDEQVKGHFGNEHGRTGAGRVADSGANVGE
jgi:hypothetical protein